MHNAKNRVLVPYRPMTRPYLVRSMIVMGCLGVMQAFGSRHGFAEGVGQAAATGILGGLVWGWVFWRAGLYRLYPAYLDGSRTSATG
jgi:hypothetical protein